MKLYFFGHEYRYAAEQMLMTLFPGEKPEYPEGKPSGRRMEVRLHRAACLTTAVCLYCSGEASFSGRAAVRNAALTDAVTISSLCQQIIKLAIYRAVLRSGREKPAWGALTGVRPGKLMAPLLQKGMTREQALSSFMKSYDVSPARAELCADAAVYTMNADRSLNDRDVCLYLGVPFCPTRCSYCSFVSQSVEKNMAMIPAFLKGLSYEIAAVAGQVTTAGLHPVSFYIGGGTPTTLSAEQLDSLLLELETAFDFSRLREFTVEAGRPDTISMEKLRVLRNHGVNRVSVNPQTMSDQVLDIIGRKHSAQDILDALDLVQKVGGFQVNMDLIAGLPGDTEEGFRETLDTVLELAPENITVHTLSIKRGARLRFGDARLPTDAEVAGMLDYAAAGLRGRAYAPYYLYRQKNMSGGFENVGWTQPDCENLYNICIMEELCSILAMGAGGSTKLIRRDGGKNERMIAPKYPQEYLDAMDRICREKERIGQFFHSAKGE
ncbi:MAG: coproporphyrinogen dehydrogenase HemZ [Oscillospiraceae bacterium]|nr:coproporphyrinogen dehydrogenase HemZ [Oscillospiraceae bacterium]